ncbi:MAG: hypothetical protein ABI621_05965 [Chloroflexota bacterium]
MFASILILMLFLPAVFLPYTLNSFFSSGELNEMGILLDVNEKTREDPMSISGRPDHTIHLDSEDSPIGGGVFFVLQVE